VITDEEMVFDALRRYAAWRQEFADRIHQEGAIKSDGAEYTKEEKAWSLQAAKQADRLAEYAREKVESPIIVMQ
jgi:major membrane immunogen (membrane-anchored lipoprotein)